jgi:plastocyanin
MGQGSEVSGHIQITGAPAKTESTPIVYAEPLDDHPPVKPGHYQMIQRNKMFVPHQLAVPVGSTVSFPNGDPIFHNVFSISPPAPFDLGLYRAGSSKTLVFTEPAYYRVFCNIHPQMTAMILVLPTSWITEADAAGTYRLDLPPGRYRLTAWSERSAPVSVPIVVEAGRLSVPEISVDESKFVEATHKNKYGQDYPSNSYQPLRR